MNKNELMVGDWIMYEQSPFKIKGIFAKEGSRVPLSSNDYWVYAESYSFIYGFHITRCIPIPLSEDILKANKFSLESEGINEFKNINIYKFGNFHGTWYGNMGKSSFTAMAFGMCQINLYYVHELQHALRLCGLNELADEFIIPQHE